MSRGAETRAKQTFAQAQDVSKTAQSNATSLSNTLTPFYASEMTDPQGFGADLPGINTAGQQSVGGALSAEKGEAGLRAARTRNQGADQAVEDEGTRTAMRTNSDNALNTQKANALLKETQRQAGAEGTAGLYGTNVNETLSAMGLQNASTDALTKAGQSGWFQNMLGFMNASANAAKGAAALGAHV